MLMDKLALGTVQLGMEYGVGSSVKKLDSDQVEEILSTASELGIKTIDTASLYGNAQERLSNSNSKSSFNYISKTINCSEEKVSKSFLIDFEKAIQESCNLLKVNNTKLNGLLFHRPRDVFKKDGEKLFEIVHKYKLDGYIEKIGFSVYEPSELIELKKHFDFDLVQLPVNLFDHRAQKSEIIDTLFKDGVEFHSRSTFLKGLIFQEENNIPTNIKDHINKLRIFKNLCLELNCTPAELAFSYVQSLEFLSKIVIGVQDADQLRDTVSSFGNAAKISNIDYDLLSVNDPIFLNPGKWS